MFVHIRAGESSESTEEWFKLSLSMRIRIRMENWGGWCGYWNGNYWTIPSFNGEHTKDL